MLNCLLWKKHSNWHSIRYSFSQKTWIFSDSQAAIQRLQKSSLKAEQSHVLVIENWIEKIKTKHQIDIHLSWVSDHMNITGNELADQTAKKRAELQQINIENIVSLSFIKRKIRESALLKWQEEYVKTKKGKFYSQFDSFLRWKIYKKTVKKKVWSAFMQLKLNHDYFKSYLVRLSDYTTDRCYVCSTREDSEHLILHCKVTQSIKRRIKTRI